MGYLNKIKKLFLNNRKTAIVVLVLVLAISMAFLFGKKTKAVNIGGVNIDPGSVNLSLSPGDTYTQGLDFTPTQGSTYYSVRVEAQNDPNHYVTGISPTQFLLSSYGYGVPRQTVNVIISIPDNAPRGEYYFYLAVYVGPSYQSGNILFIVNISGSGNGDGDGDDTTQCKFSKFVLDENENPVQASGPLDFDVGDTTELTLRINGCNKEDEKRNKVDAMLLQDISGSMQLPWGDPPRKKAVSAASAMKIFVNRTRNPDDKVGYTVYTTQSPYNPQIKTEVKKEMKIMNIPNKLALLSEIQPLWYGATPMGTGLKYALEGDPNNGNPGILSSMRDDANQYIILTTDGWENNGEAVYGGEFEFADKSNAGFQNSPLALAMRKKIVIYTVGIGRKCTESQCEAPDKPCDPDFLQKIADDTEGQCFYTIDDDELKQAFEAIFNEIHQGGDASVNVEERLPAGVCYESITAPDSLNTDYPLPYSYCRAGSADCEDRADYLTQCVDNQTIIRWNYSDFAELKAIDTSGTSGLGYEDITIEISFQKPISSTDPNNPYVDLDDCDPQYNTVTYEWDPEAELAPYPKPCQEFGIKVSPGNVVFGDIYARSLIHFLAAGIDVGISGAGDLTDYVGALWQYEGLPRPNNYDFRNYSSSKWDTDKFVSIFSEMDGKICKLYTGALPVNLDLNNVGNCSLSNHPMGAIVKIWRDYPDPVNISDAIHVSGKGSVIVSRRDLNINQNITSDDNSPVAFIVRGGNINIGPEVEKIDALLFAFDESGQGGGNINIQSGTKKLTMKGMIIGKKISIPFAKKFDIRFDTNFYENPPPGIAQIILPIFEEIAP